MLDEADDQKLHNPYLFITRRMKAETGIEVEWMPKPKARADDGKLDQPCVSGVSTPTPSLDEGYLAGGGYSVR